jgi:hypothetical protein
VNPTEIRAVSSLTATCRLIGGDQFSEKLTTFKFTSTLMMEAVYSSKVLLSTYQSTCYVVQVIRSDFTAVVTSDLA